MKTWIAFWNIVWKDMRAYYLKPPNVSWGLIFPMAWTAMFFIKSGRALDDVLGLLPGVVAVSILFGTTSMLAVTVTFEKKGRSFERLLLAPIPLELLMLAKTGGAILFGVVNALVPVAIAGFLADLSPVAWAPVIPAVVLIAVASTFMGLFIAVSVSEIFEAQTFSNFFPIDALPMLLKPLAYGLPLTYGVDILKGGFHGSNNMPLPLDFAAICLFCLALFFSSLKNIHKRWIA